MRIFTRCFDPHTMLRKNLLRNAKSWIRRFRPSLLKLRHRWRFQMLTWRKSSNWKIKLTKLILRLKRRRLRKASSEMPSRLWSSKSLLWNDSWVSHVSFLKMKSWEIYKTSRMMPWRSEMIKLTNSRVFSTKTKNLMIRKFRKMMRSRRCTRRKKTWSKTSSFHRREWLRWTLNKSRLIKRSYNWRKKRWRMMNRWTYLSNRRSLWRRKSRSLKTRLSRLRMIRKKISRSWIRFRKMWKIQRRILSSLTIKLRSQRRIWMRRNKKESESRINYWN